MENRNPAIGKIALGPALMFFHSIQEHRKRHHGRSPRKIEIHPAVMKDFRDQIRRDYPPRIQQEVENGSFFGVPILQNRHAQQPMLITHEGAVEFM